MSQQNDSPKAPARILYLVDLFKTESLTEKEHDELDAWIEQSDDNVNVFADLIKDMDDRYSKYDMPDIEEAIRADERKTVLKPIFTALGILGVLVAIFVVFRYVSSGNIAP